MDGYNGSSIHISGKKFSPWLWLTVIVAILSLTQCTIENNRIKAAKAAADDAWLNSSEYAFRFCITTAAGINGTATPEQIIACNKATKG